MRLLSDDVNMYSLVETTKNNDNAFNVHNLKSMTPSINDNQTKLAISSDKFYTQEKSFFHSIDESNKQIAALEISDKSIIEQAKILDIIKSKFLQASQNMNNIDGQEAIQKDINQLLMQLQNIVSQSDYSDKESISPSKLLSAINTHIFQVGQKIEIADFSLNMQNNTENYPKIMDTMLSSLEQNHNEIKQNKTQIRQTVKDLITQAINSENKNISNQIDYVFESKNFTKDTLLQISGKLIFTQANIDGKRVFELLKQ